MPDCARCHNTGRIERTATPAEVDAGCELGVAFDRCPACSSHVRDCAICGEIVPDDQWRWHCDHCGATLHYRCAPGGVPVSAPVVCPCENCGGLMHGIESRAAAEARGQGSMF